MADTHRDWGTEISPGSWGASNEGWLTCAPRARKSCARGTKPGAFFPGATANKKLCDLLRATDRKSASKCQGKWPDQTLDQAFGLPEVLVAVSTSRLSCKRAGKTRNSLKESPEQFGARMHRDYERFRDIVKAAKLKPE